MKPFAEYTSYDALGLADLVRRKEVHPEELVEAAIERIERFNPALNAVIDKLYDRARRAAREPLPDGPLAGVPYLLKDMVAHAGTRLTLGTMLLKQVGYTPKKSHEVIARSERAGLIVVGKTNACELGLLPVTEPRAFGPTANPWRLHHSPGGSSGGSAAAVAAGLVPLAHGNDGGGSIRIPASCCGVFGFKPSRGRNPGHADDSPDGLTTEHCLSRSVRDSAALLDVTRGPRSGDRWWAPEPSRPYLQEVSIDPEPLRIAFSTCDLLGRRAHPDCCEAVQRAAALCERLGHKVQEAQPAIDGQRFNELFTDLWVTMAAAIYHLFMRYVRRHRALALTADVLGDRRVLEVLGRLQLRSLDSPFEPGTHAAAKLGEKLSHAQFYGTASELQRISFELADFLSEHDVWLTPVLAEPPLRTGELASLSLEELRERTLAYAAYTPLCNAAGVPAMSLPLHHNGAGLPIGVHFAGRFGDEATLFRLAGQIERAEPWADRWPDLVRA